MKFAIVEDQIDDREHLLVLLKEYMSHLNMDCTYDCFESGEAFLAKLEPDIYDLCFMDIYMGEVGGVEAVERLRKIDPACLVMFLTDSPSHWDVGYRLGAKRYLKKPASTEALLEAMPDCLELVRCAQRQLIVNIGKREMELPFSKIYYIATAGRNVEIHGKSKTITAGAQTTFDELAAPLLSDYRFLSIGRGLVVNMGFVTAVDKGGVLMENGDRLPTSRSKTNEVSDTVARFQFQHG